MQTVDLLLFLFELLALDLQLRQHVLEADALRVHLLLRRLDDARVEAEPRGDGEGVGLAGDADEELIGGAKRLHVELTARVLDARRGHGKGLELSVVRGGGDLRAAGADVLDDRDGEGRALDRVGARAQLVEKDEGIAVRLVEDIDNGLHVRGEGGKALLDALLVADVGEDAGKDAHRAAVARGNVQSALRHQAEETERFETDGLAAGVGACDDEGIEAAAHLNVDGHGLGGIEQRMAGAAEGNAAVRADLGPRGVHLVAQLAAGKDEVEVDENVIVPQDRLGKACRLGGEGEEDALDLLLLLGLQLLELVVRLHDAHRLNKERRAGGGNVVDKAGQVAAVLRLDGHDEAPVALRDERLLQRALVAGRGDDLLQDLSALGACRTLVTADIRQLGAGGVGDLVLGEDGGRDLIL